MGDKTIVQTSFLQEGVSCALATLHAIEGCSAFDALPETDAAREQHNHGLWLLSMLRSHLTQIQQKVDALDAPPVADKAEG